MRDGDAGDGGPPEVIIGDQEGARYRGQHPDLVPGVREVRQDGRLDLADDLERARAHDGHARTRTSLQVPAPRHRPRGAICRLRAGSTPRIVIITSGPLMPLLVRSAGWRGDGLDGSACARGVLGDRIVTAMSAALPVPDAPVVSVAAAIARMEAIAAALPAAD